MSERDIPGYFGPSLRARGTLTGKGSLAIRGRFDGEIQIDGSVDVEPGALVNANAELTTMLVAGDVVGDVHAHDSVRVVNGGRVEGDVRALRIAIDDGGVLLGGVEMDFAIDGDADE